MVARTRIGFTLVETRMWGGLVGILGFPVLMDGGAITAPNLGIRTSAGDPCCRRERAGASGVP